MAGEVYGEGRRGQFGCRLGVSVSNFPFEGYHRIELTIIPPFELRDVIKAISAEKVSRRELKVPDDKGSRSSTAGQQ